MKKADTAFEWRQKNEASTDGLKNEWVAYHPRHGVLVHDASFSALGKKLRLLRTHVAQECVTFFVVGHVSPSDKPPIQTPDAIVAPVKVPSDTAQPKDEPLDFFSNVGARETETLQAFAKRFNLRTTEVLMKLLSWGHTGIHVNSKLTLDQVRSLELEYAGRGSIFDSSGSVKWTQPGFQPINPLRRDIVVD